MLFEHVSDAAVALPQLCVTVRALLVLLAWQPSPPLRFIAIKKVGQESLSPSIRPLQDLASVLTYVKCRWTMRKVLNGEDKLTHRPIGSTTLPSSR